MVGTFEIDETQTAQEVDEQSPEQRRSELKSYETQIEAGFRQIGEALAVIHEKQLWQDDYATWEQYIDRRWRGRSTKWASYLINASETTKEIEAYITENNCSDDIPLPTRESQVRPLTGLAEQDAGKVWEKVVKQHGKSPTAAQVTAVRDAIVAQPDPDERIRIQVKASGYIPIYQRMVKNELTPVQALDLVDTIKGCEPKVRGDVIRWVVSDTAMIRQLNKMYKRRSETYDEIMQFGVIHSAGDVAIPLRSATMRHLRLYLDYIQQEKLAARLAEKQSPTIEEVVTTLYRGSPEKTLEVLKREIPGEELAKIAIMFLKEMTDDKH